MDGNLHALVAHTKAGATKRLAGNKYETRAALIKIATSAVSLQRTHESKLFQALDAVRKPPMKTEKVYRSRWGVL